jgi:hypothetical protein
MRLNQFLKRNNIGIKTVELLFDFLGINIRPTLNLKLSDSEFNYIEEKLKSEDFNNCFIFLKKISIEKNRIIHESMDKLMKNGVLCSFESYHCYEFILSIYETSCYKTEIIDKIIPPDHKYNESSFKELLKWYKSHLNLIIEDQEKRENYSVTNYDEIIEHTNKKTSIGNTDDFDDSDNFDPTDVNSKGHNDSIDYEEMIMRSFQNGTSDNFGY